MSAPWLGTPVSADPAAQAQANILAQLATLQGVAPPPSAGNVRNVGVPEGGTITTFGDPQSMAVSAADYASGKYAPFDTTGWTRTGGNSTSNVYVNDKTGEVAYIGNDGRLQNLMTKDQAAAGEHAGTVAGGVESLRDQVRQGASDAKNVADAANVVGTPGIDPSVQQRVNDTVLGGQNPYSLTGGLGGVGSVPGNIMDPIQAAIARSSGISDQQGQLAQNYQPVAAPTVAGPGQIYAEFAQRGDPIQAAIAQAQAAQAAQVGQTALTPQQQAIQAQQIAAAQLGPTAMAGTSQIDAAQQAQMRAAQQGLIGGLQGAISGNEPSVAAIMLRNATDRNVANQYALAQAATGMNTGLAQRSAMINASEMNQNAVMQQALLRAQEIATARGQLGGVLDSARGADIGLATNQAGLQQQSNLANAGALNTANTTQAQLAQQAAIANQGAGLQAGTTNATLAQQNALANAGALNTTYQQNAQLQQAAGLQNAQLGTQANIANAAQQTGANTASAQLANAVNLANANNQTQANVTGAQLGTQAAIATGQNQVATNTLNQKAVNDAYQNQIAAAGQAGQTSIGAGDVAAKLAEAEAKKQAALISGISAGAAALISDRRQKTDIKPAEAELAEFASKLKPYSFRYKAPDKPGTAPGQRFGIMAQDLEKSRIGRTLVREDEDGTKTIDVPQSIGAILATLSAMNKRIEAR